MPDRVPQRIQRKRTKGWRTPECGCGCGQPARYVGRPTKWGNTDWDAYADEALQLREAGEVWVDHDYPPTRRNYEQCDTCHGDRTMQHHCDLLAAARQAARQVGLFLEDGKRERLNVALVLLQSHLPDCPQEKP